MTIGITTEDTLSNDSRQRELNALAYRALGAIEDLLAAYNPEGVVREDIMRDFADEIEETLMDITWEIEELSEINGEVTDATL